MKGPMRNALLRRFARAVKARRLQLGLRQAEVAKRMDVNQARIAELESGHANPRLWTMARVARALKTSVSELMGR